MYDLCTDTKSDAEKHSLFMMRTMLQHLQRNFEFYWDIEQDFSIDEKTIGFLSGHKNKLRIMFKDAGDCLQADDVCDRGYTYSFIYHNDDIPDSKHYLCATSERVIWILKLLNTEWKNVYMYNLYISIRL